MSQQHTTASAEETAAMFDLNLKNRVLAALLAWLVPGLGHLYQGRTAKGLLFMICLVSTFAFGYLIGGGRTAYASTIGFEFSEKALEGKRRVSHGLAQMIPPHLWFVGQSGIGSVAIPCVIEQQRALAGKAPLLGDALRPPSLIETDFHTDANGKTVHHPDELAKWFYEGGFYFEMGCVYTLIAGMLNILVVYDAYSGPLIVRKQEPEDDAGGGADEKTKPDSTNG